MPILPVFKTIRRRSVNICILLALILSLFDLGTHLPVTASDVGDEPVRPPSAIETKAFAPGVVLIGLPGEVVASTRQNSNPNLTVLQDLPLFATHHLTPTAILAAPKTLDEPLIVRASTRPGQERAIIADLARDPRILFAEPDWIVHGAALDAPEEPEPFAPNDPMFRSLQWGMQRIGVSRAWALGLGASVQVAVIDSGIDATHPDLRGRVLRGKNYITPGADPVDDSGHGTHVSGIIGASMNNGVNIAGLAPRALIDPRKALDRTNSGQTSNIALAIREAADAGAKIINLSLTAPSPSATLESAVNYAAGKGVLLVAAAGNNAHSPVAWPAAYPSVVAVAATDRDDNRAYYSPTGPELDLAAPGGLPSQLIYSLWPTGVICGTVAPAGSCSAVGTSMSAAFVSGAAALIWGMRPDLTAADVKMLLRETARKTGAPAEEVGAGRLDIHAAVRRALISDLKLSTSQITDLIPSGSQPYTKTVTLSNPSSEPLTWDAHPSGGDGWLIVPSGSGVIRYGQPAQLSFVISPTLLAVGDYSADISFTAKRPNGSGIVLNLPVKLLVRSAIHRVFLARTAIHGSTSAWHLPDAGGSQDIRLTDSSSIGLLLPFTYTLESQAITTVRLYADGFVTLPATEIVDSQPVGCLPLDSPAKQAIYAWWTDLDPGTGGTIRAFRSTQGAYVLEFQDVPSGSTITPAYQISFQIALYPDGVVNLIYRDAPASADQVVVGMEINDSLLYAQVACRANSTVLGALPHGGDTITLRPSDLR